MNIYSIIWAALGVLMTFSEIIIPGFTIFFFGIGGLITALITLLFPLIGLPFQGIVWIGSSLLLLIVLRKRFAKTFRGNIIDSSRNTQIGMKALVVEKITPDKPGRIKFDGTTWKAHSYTETIEEGEEVDIIEKSKDETLSYLVTKSIIDD